MTRAMLSAALTAALTAAQLWPLGAAAQEPPCIDNQFEVAWVHPGVSFFLDRGDQACAGDRLVLKEGENGCFATPVVLDGSARLSGLDATTGACRAICPITRQTTRVVFDASASYACAD